MIASKADGHNRAQNAKEKSPFLKRDKFLFPEVGIITLELLYTDRQTIQRADLRCKPKRLPQ